MSEQNKPAPVWRLLEPGEIIKPGDQEYSCESYSWILSEPYGEKRKGGNPIRRRMEPDLVKAELLTALENFTRAAEWWRNNQDSPKSALMHFLIADKFAREAIARAKS